MVGLRCVRVRVIFLSCVTCIDNCDCLHTISSKCGKHRSQESQLTTLFSCRPTSPLLVLDCRWCVTLAFYMFVPPDVDCGLVNGMASTNQYQMFVSSTMPPWPSHYLNTSNLRYNTYTHTHIQSTSDEL